MRERVLHPFRPSSGERSLLIAAALTAIVGAGLAKAVVAQIHDTSLLDKWSGLSTWCAISGAFGAVSALYLGRAWLGQPGAVGTLRALAGIVVVSGLAALVAGTLILPGYGTMFGPMLLALNILDHPALALGWAYALILAHMLFREYRAERRRVARSSPAQHRPKVFTDRLRTGRS